MREKEKSGHLNNGVCGKDGFVGLLGTGMASGFRTWVGEVAEEE